MDKISENPSSSKVLAEIFNRYIGCGRQFDAKDIAFRAGCHVNSVYSACHANAGIDVCMDILRCLPDEANVEFIHRCLGFHYAARIDSAGGCHHEVGREISLGTAEYVEAVSDGHIDHREDRALVQRYYRIMAVLGRATAAARCVRPAGR